MTLCVSTSSPLVSVAVVASGEVVWTFERLASPSVNPILREAFGEILAVVDRDQISELVVDAGPGSFIGTRAGVMWVKSIGFAAGKRCGMLSSFDLIAPNLVVAVPNRKYDAFVRRPGSAPELVLELGSEVEMGYGPLVEKIGKENTFPHARRVLEAYDRVKWTDAEGLKPMYLADPSISMPKRPLNLMERAK
jgi:hypothetical protein